MEPLKVLNLEDDLSIQNLYRKALPEAVFEVRCFGNGRNGPEILCSVKSLQSAGSSCRSSKMMLPAYPACCGTGLPRQNSGE